MRQTITFFTLFFAVLLNGQGFSIPSQPSRNMVYINPAYTGYYETTVASLMNRTTWLGITGSLQFQNAEIHAPLKKQSVALGLQIYNEKFGATNTTEAFVNYCHRITINSSKLAFGIKMGIQSSSMSEVVLRDPTIDPSFQSANYLLPNFGVGVAFYNKLFYGGISVPYLLKIEAGTDGTSTITYDFNDYSFVGSLGAKIPVSSNLKLEPVGLFEYSLILEYAYMAALNLSINDRFLLGFGYRSEQAAVVNLGYHINYQISFQYTYDYIFSSSDVSYAKSSHEIGFLFYFGYKVNTVNPRDF